MSLRLEATQRKSGLWLGDAGKARQAVIGPFGWCCWRHSAVSGAAASLCGGNVPTCLQGAVPRAMAELKSGTWQPVANWCAALAARWWW